MATTITLKGDNQCARTPIVWVVRRDAATPAEVELYADGGEEIRKTIVGTYAEVNVSDYLSGYIDKSLVSTTTGGALPVGGNWRDWERSIGYTVGCGGVQASGEAVYARADARAETVIGNLLLSELGTEREICEGQLDELSMCAPNASCYFTTQVWRSGTRIATGGFDTGDTPRGLLLVRAQSGDFSVRISEAGQRVPGEIVINYRVVPQVGHRLSWINKFGATDSYNFEVLSKERLDVTKSKMYGRDGWRVTDVYAERVYSVRSMYLNIQQANGVASILSSPRVWCRTLGDAEVDIIADSVNIQERGGLSAVSFDFRTAQREIW